MSAAMAWLEPVERALDEVRGPVTIFFRDDDAGWADDRLWALLDRMDAAAMPIDLAVIPFALEPETAARLLERRAAVHGRLGLHQHGCRHENHEREGRPCELGPARPPGELRRDVLDGAARLAGLLPGAVDPIFTPPWNRCSPDTGPALLEAGITTLSREARATPLGTPGLRELPITVDWLKQRDGVRLAPPAIGRLVADAIVAGGPVGVMFHHAVMDDEELDRVGALLALLGSHPSAHPLTMREILEVPS